MTGVTGERHGGDLTPSGKAIMLKRAENLLGVFPKGPVWQPLPGEAEQDSGPLVASSGRMEHAHTRPFPGVGGQRSSPAAPALLP